MTESKTPAKAATAATAATAADRAVDDPLTTWKEDASKQDSAKTIENGDDRVEEADEAGQDEPGREGDDDDGEEGDEGEQEEECEYESSADQDESGHVGLSYLLEDVSRTVSIHRIVHRRSIDSAIATYLNPPKSSRCSTTKTNRKMRTFTNPKRTTTKTMIQVRYRARCPSAVCLDEDGSMSI